jgi:hypothetical protein
MLKTAACGAGLVLALALATPAAGFVVEGPSFRAWSPHEDVERAARWDARGAAMTETGERGLGGGLEYALDNSVCSALTFLDQPAPTCAQIKASFVEALARWEAEHPMIRFTDVTDRVALRMQGRTAAADGQGAEIDVIAVGPQDFRPFESPRLAAMTNYYFDIARRPMKTNGRIAERAAGVLTAADIRLSTKTCYFLDPAFEQVGCAHFGSLIKHEIGHVLGVEHPDQHPQRNLAPAPVSEPDKCDSAAARFVLSAVIDASAAARSVLYGAAVWRHGLTADDIAARDALYPRCVPSQVEFASLPPQTLHVADGVASQSASAGAISSVR